MQEKTTHTKVCTSCNSKLQIEQFANSLRNKDGKSNRCKSCDKEYRLINKNSISNTSRVYSQSNKEKILIYQRNHRSENYFRYKIKTAYRNMITRCYNENNKSFDLYGGRGIEVCYDWRNSFEMFYNWCVTSGANIDLSIDRIDNDGNYEPSNCRWADAMTQSRNTRILRTTNKTGYRGVSFRKDRNKYSTSIKVNYKKITLGCYNNAIDAARAYNNYVIKNNLEHTLNFVVNVL